MKILLALEPTWTVSINGMEFIPLSAAEIEIEDTNIRFGRHSRKILGIEWLRPNVARVRTQSRLRAAQDVVTFYPGSVLPSNVDARRRRRLFQNQIARALTGFFHSRQPVRQILHADKQRGIGGAYPRFIIGNRAAIAVDPDESAPVIDCIMRAAIMWSAIARQRISIVVPAHRSRTIVTRLLAMPSLSAEFEWLQWDGETIAPLETKLAESETYVHEYHQPNVQSEVARICALAPDLLQPVPHIPGKAVSIRLRGLEVARVAEAGTTYPMGEPLEPLIESLERDRRYGSRHPLARAYEERWLESNLIRQIGTLLPVSSEWIYPQVPSFVGQDRSIIDLLTITPNGRLVVIEVKVTSDPELPFQALDYWLAVERHRKAGDFTARGYFQGIDIRNEPALLVIVAPLLAFHKSLNRLVANLPRNLPLLQIGINQSWKREIKILRRKGSLG
ncbi:MAG TPA: hypothetical protein VK210_16610 [Terriglobia bacterium]|nr:hypothetical protein [Terriglobia bacterium]